MSRLSPARIEFVREYYAAHAKVTLGRAAFHVNWEQVYKEFDNPNVAFVFYEYATVHVHGLNGYEPRYAGETRVSYRPFLSS